MRKPKNYAKMIEILKQDYENTDLEPISFHYIGKDDSGDFGFCTLAIDKKMKCLNYVIEHVDMVTESVQEGCILTKQQWANLTKLNFDNASLLYDPK